LPAHCKRRKLPFKFLFIQANLSRRAKKPKTKLWYVASSGTSQQIKSRMAERLAELNSDPLTRPAFVEAWAVMEQPIVVKPKVPPVHHNTEPMSSETFVHHIAMVSV
jgi:hypothetical protein